MMITGFCIYSPMPLTSLDYLSYNHMSLEVGVQNLEACSRGPGHLLQHLEARLERQRLVVHDRNYYQSISHPRTPIETQSTSVIVGS